MDGRVNRHCKWSHFTDSAFFMPMLIETIHTWASFIDSDSLMTRATCNCGRVRREHFVKWPPGRQESCGSRSAAGKKTVFLRPKSRWVQINGSQNLLGPQNERGGSKLSALVTRR